jgi:formate hydrogenlyase subunit 3/multisubunit Na+/H+ antiporter MnhD subunit
MGDEAMAQPEETSTPANGQRNGSIADLTRRVSQDASGLVRAEIELAKEEIAQQMGKMAAGGGLLAVAAFVGLTAFAVFVATVILALSTTMDAWLAALIVGIALVIIGAIIALIGRSRLRAGTPPVPPETVQRVKEDVQWVKEHATSGEK